MAAPDPVTHERVYQRIRSDILDGTIEPGRKIAASDLARAFEASVTPVREALYRLVGEGLITMAQSGFHASVMDDAMVLDIIDLSQKFLIIGLQRLAAGAAIEISWDWTGQDPEADEAVKMLEATFSHLFRATDNDAIVHWGDRTMEQLHSVRLAQCRVSRRARREGLTLLELVVARDRTRLARQILAHHRRLKQTIVSHQTAIALRFSRHLRA
ncbi:MAG: hypothetical protein C0494_05975 [Sphingobium sp.]|nr:hypothetical protein [Sphingobium sp.]